MFIRSLGYVAAKNENHSTHQRGINGYGWIDRVISD